MAVMAANSSAAHNARSNRTANVSNERAARGSHGRMGQGFSGRFQPGTSIWGENLGDQHVGDAGLEGRAGSSSLLSASESDGWNGRPNIPWSTVNPSSAGLSRVPSSGMTTSPIQTRAPDRGAAGLSEATDTSYFSVPRSSAMGVGSATHSAYLNTGPEGISPSGDGISLGTIGGMRNGESRRQFSTSAFAGSPVGTAFPIRSELSSPLDNTRPEDVTGSMTMSISDATQLGRNPYAHASHNSASFAPQRPAHSPYPSFHSETQGFEGRYGSASVDLNGGLDQLQLNDGNFTGHQNSNRPAFLSHHSLDASMPRLRYQNQADEANYPSLATYTHESTADLPLGYSGNRPRAGDGPISPTEYSRINTPLYHGLDNSQVGGLHYRHASGSRMPDNAAANLDRRMRAMPTDMDLPQQAANPLQRGAYAAAYDLSRYPHGAVNPMAPYYQINPMTAAALASRHDNEPTRSPLLEEFRANSKGNKRYELKDIYDHIVEFSGDQHGSRFIQQKLETANSDEKEKVFQEISIDSLQLMTDVFGNYVIQKLFEHGNQTQKKQLANQMKTHILDLTTQMYGCRVVQKALEHILTDQQASMVKELEQHVVKCVRDQNGNHVIQKAIERVPSEHVQFIINAFIGHVDKLATHPYGCRVIQRMLEHCKEQDRRAILSELHACTAKLIPDQFGNYVIQHVIENGAAEDKRRMITVVMSQLLSYSKHKFASNVVEKGILFGEESQRRQIITLLTTPSNDRGENPLLGLIRDQYGNYVIQKVFLKLKGEERESLVEQLKPLLSQLKKYSYGKQIAAIEKLVHDHCFPSNGSISSHTASSTTPPNSHKSSPQPSKRPVNAIESSRAPGVGAAPPTPPPNDNQNNADGSVENKSVARSTVTPLAECESADAMPNAPVDVSGAS